MKQPGHLIFVCQNLRGTDDPRGSCMRRGSKEVLDLLKERRAALGLKDSLRVLGATCLGACEAGIVTLVVDGEGATFYGRVDRASAEAIVQEHVLGEGPGPALARHRLRPDDLLDLSALEGEGEAGSGRDDQGEEGR